MGIWGGALIITLGSLGILAGIFISSSLVGGGYALAIPKLGDDYAPKLTYDIRGGGEGKLIYWDKIVLLMITGWLDIGGRFKLLLISVFFNS